MNIDEMHIGVRLALQGIDANTRSGYLPEEIDYYLNKSIRAYVKGQVQQIRTLRSEDRDTHQAIENLRTLIISVNYSKDDFEPSVKIPAAVQTTLPGKEGVEVGSEGNTVIRAMYENFIHGHAAMRQNNCVTHRPLFSANISLLRKYVQTQTAGSSWHKELPMFIMGNELHILKEFHEDTIENAIIFYVKPFARVNKTSDPQVSSDLPEHTHEEIVDNTVMLMMSDTGQRPVQQTSGERR